LKYDVNPLTKLDHQLPKNYWKTISRVTYNPFMEQLSQPNVTMCNNDL